MGCQYDSICSEAQPRLDRPVVVTGTPRSGKSLVASILAHAPEFLLMSEPLMIWDQALGIRADDRRSGGEATEALRSTIVQACCQALRRAGKRRYLDDLAYHALRIPFLCRVMPSVRIIHVVRDPRLAIPEMLYGWTHRDTISAALVRRRQHLRLRTLPRLALRFVHNYWTSRWSGRRATWGPRVPGLADFQTRHSPAEVAAYQWQQMIQIARSDLAKLPSEQYMELSFEQMLENPSDMAHRLAEFCQVDNPDRLADFAAELVDPAHKFDKKVHPTESEWAVIYPRIAELCGQLGYGGNAPQPAAPPKPALGPFIQRG